VPGDWHAPGGGCAILDEGGTALVAAGAATACEVRAADGATDVRTVAIGTTGGRGRTVRVPAQPTRVRGLR
jgi:hypothetical protein